MTKVLMATPPTDRNPEPSPRRLAIDMLTPAEAGERLRLDAVTLMAVVNNSLLPAYDFDGEIRFRSRDVDAVAKFVTGDEG